jgi:hypothetical protein
MLMTTPTVISRIQCTAAGVRPGQSASFAALSAAR